MKTKFFMILSLSLVLALSSCEKDELETVVENTEELSDAATIFFGTFINEVHPTSGTANILKTKEGKYFLRLTDLKSDSGPDLRIYLSEDKRATKFVEVASTVKNGTYSLALPENIDFDSNKYVLIWCKQFSVLFGSAEIK